jgi:hypothetical protein
VSSARKACSRCFRTSAFAAAGSRWGIGAAGAFAIELPAQFAALGDRGLVQLGDLI